MKRWLLIAAAAAMLWVPTRAEASPNLRFGLTDDPDSIFVGFGFEFPFSRTRSTTFIFEPAVDLGIGDDPDFFTIRGTGHFKFLFPLSRAERVWIYPLVGVSIYHIEFDGPADNTDAAIDLGGGFRWDRFSFEFFFSFDDDEHPDITAAFAVRF